MIASNNKKIDGLVINNSKVGGIIKDNKVVFSSKPKIVTFADGTDEEIVAMLKAHYRGVINISEYWHVGDTRVMHLNAMAKGTGADETHVAQNMTMVIIGIEHDNLKTPINGKNKAAITLQCKECLGNNGTSEEGYIFGTSASTSNNDNYSNNPRRNWLNETFINALPNTIQPLVQTIIKKNLANHTNNTAGPDTEDKAFLTSYSEMFGSTSHRDYKGSPAIEGEQYPYYDTNAKRIKYANSNGIASYKATDYWLRSPSSSDGSTWMLVENNGEASSVFNNGNSGIVPAFCL